MLFLTAISSGVVNYFHSKGLSPTKFEVEHKHTKKNHIRYASKLKNPNNEMCYETSGYVFFECKLSFLCKVTRTKMIFQSIEFNVVPLPLS